jgi:hypothetical protein
MRNLKLLFLAAITLIMSSCASVYHSPNAKQISSNHQKIAVIPPTVSIAARKRVDAAALQEQQETESLNFQKDMYSWLLTRKRRNKMQLNILDIETTNAKLAKAGYFNSQIMTPNEIAELLEVDAILTSNYALSKPISEGAAVAISILAGVDAPTNEARVTLEIHDKETKDMIWNYNHTLSGSIGTSSGNLVNALMRNASRKMPYLK